MSDYTNLLRHPLWQKKRLYIFQRDNFQCQKCFDIFSNLQVHHKYYKPDTFPWDYPDDCFVTVCDLCHEKEEFIKWILKNIEYNLFEQKFNSSDIVEIRQLIIRRVVNNKHRDSVRQYMSDLKNLIVA